MLHPVPNTQLRTRNLKKEQTSISTCYSNNRHKNPAMREVLKHLPKHNTMGTLQIQERLAMWTEKCEKPVQTILTSLLSSSVRKWGHTDRDIAVRFGKEHVFLREGKTNPEIQELLFLAAVESHVSRFMNVDGQQSTVPWFGHEPEVPRQTRINQDVVSGWINGDDTPRKL